MNTTAQQFESLTHTQQEIVIIDDLRSDFHRAAYRLEMAIEIWGDNLEDSFLRDIRLAWRRYANQCSIVGVDPVTGQ